MNSNRTLAEQVNDALLDAAQAKAEALRATKQAARILDRLFLEMPGTVDGRKAAARTHPTYTDAEDDAVEAESRAILAKAVADGLMVMFEEWRSTEATRRQDGKFIAAQR